MRFIIPLAVIALLILPSCVSGQFDPDTGRVGLAVEPLASASSVQEVADMSKDYADDIAAATADLAAAIQEVAEQAGAAEAAAKAEIAAAKIDVAKQVSDERKEAFDINQLLANEYFWLIMGSLVAGTGGTLAVRKKIQAARDELPPDVELVDDEVA